MLTLLHLIVTITCVISIETNETPKELNLTKCKHNDILVTLLTNSKNLIEDAKRYASLWTSCNEYESSCNIPMDCAGVLEKTPSAKSGVYSVWPQSRISTGPINVYCDMEDDGGAWTVIQRRGDFNSGKEYFFKDWKSYKNGFGDLEKDFWLGNDNIFSLTNQKANVVKFTLSDWEGNNTYATYDECWIEDESRNYTMHVNGYRGTAGDSFYGTNGVPFSAKDQDNDSYEANSCSQMYKGGWWYASCHTANLNGLYLKGKHESYADGVEWYYFKGDYYSLKDTVIKIRPKKFKRSETLTPQ